jgi:hypothetical protein
MLGRSYRVSLEQTCGFFRFCRKIRLGGKNVRRGVVEMKKRAPFRSHGKGTGLWAIMCLAFAARYTQP